MLRDVFYYGKKPNVHPREQYAKNLVDARRQATTDHFWVINEFCDYTNFDWDFDFEFLPNEDVWAEDHNNVWPSYHQKDSGTWLCPKQLSEVVVYRCDVDPLKRKNNVSSKWKILENIDMPKWDFSWHPDPSDPPYIYKWGCKYFPVEFKSCIEYHVEGATEIKYMNSIVELLPNWDSIVEVQKVDQSRWDMSWRPDPREPAYNYVWGNKYIDGRLRSTLEYHVPGAIETKYMPEMIPVLPEWERWEIIHEVDKTTFDFCWRPDPREPDLIYVFGNDQHEGNIMPTIEYRMLGATERKYVNDITYKAKLAPHPELFEHLEKASGIDYTWRPDPTSPPYIYAWGNQWNKPEDKVSIQYVVEGATEYRYMEERSKRKPCMDNWVVPDNVDTTGFDFSWEPSPADPAYIYQFGTQWQKTGGPRYVVEGATEVKFVSTLVAKALPTKDKWTLPTNVDVTDFDFSWHPDDTSPPYVYVFPTQWALSGGPVYTVDGATEIKYVDDLVAKAVPDKTNWEVPMFVDSESFDFSWHPYAQDEPYIYQFGTQWQKTGGPVYKTPGVHKNSDVKYIDTRIIKSKRLPSKRGFATLNNYQIKDFDYTWHPDTTEEPYIYVFGNNLYPAEIMPTIEYAVPGATQIKYVNDIVATLGEDKTNWEIPENIDVTGFDFSWKPNPKDPAFIYQFGTQWQKTGGPRYVVADATEVKFVETQKVKALATKTNWSLPTNIDAEFDFSWHPDDTSPPYIYYFATQWALSGGPIYTVPGATEVKYVEDLVAKALPDKTNWEVPEFVDKESFDYSWHPYVEDEPYIYQFGTQWQKTGGPKYITPGVHANSLTKYIDVRVLKATRLPSKRGFATLGNVQIADFDYTWHPDTTEEPYIYVFGNNLYPAEIMPTIEYAVPGAKQIKYVNDIVATLAVDMTNWEIPDNIDATAIDFSWKPNPKDPPYIYQFGTQHQKTGGPRYVVPSATEVKYVDTHKAIALPSTKNWEITENIDTSNFDFSWHPDDSEPPYIYAWGNQWNKVEDKIVLSYVVPGASTHRYMEGVVPRTMSMDHWKVPSDVDTEGFDFSWEPNPKDGDYVYQFGTQWQKTGGPRYLVTDSENDPVKYIDIAKVKKLPNKKNFATLNNYKIKDFDYSWHPDTTDEPYIYVFGNTQHPAQEMPTIEYAVPGAKQIKYITDIVATLAVDMTNWEIPEDLDITGFDFSWKPNPKDHPFIYEFGTQWQKTGGPRYVVPDATEIKYVSTQKAIALSDMSKWTLPSNIDVTDFDFSWHPDNTSPPYNYHFATQWALSGGPMFKMEGATATKYMEQPSAKALANRDNWEIPADIDSETFDFSWHPYAEDEPYVYQFGTQWQKTGGPRYVTPGAKRRSTVKYIDTRIIKSTKLPNKANFNVLNSLVIAEFDWSWHPDETDGEFIYVFGNTQYPAEVMPTVEYRSSPYSEKIKYINDVKAVLATDMSNWTVPKHIDISEFDFAWRPNPNDPPYVYQFGTQHQKTGGPKYTVAGATEVKYVDGSKAKTLPSKANWVIPDNVIEFDYSWHPDDTEELFSYQFGTQWQKTGGPKFVPASATTDTPVKYIDTIKAKRKQDKNKFTVLNDIEVKDFDWSWHPDETDEPFIYRFGSTQYTPEVMPVIEYSVPGATQIKYVTDIVAKLGPDKKYWKIPSDVDTTDFDFSWLPHPNDPPYVYQFGTQWQKTDGPKYIADGATEGESPIKYVSDIVSRKLPSLTNWEIPSHINVSDFDFSWHPDSTDPAYIYQFGTVIDDKDGPKYVTPNNTGEVVHKARVVKLVADTPLIEQVVPQYYIETTLEDLVNSHPTEIFWALNKNINYDKFDFTWRPEIIHIAWDSSYVSVFGSPDSVMTHTYFVNANAYLSGNKDFKFVENAKLDESYLSSLFVKPDMFFVDRGNEESKERFELLKQQFPTIQKTRYLNSWVDTINRCINRSSTEVCWILNSELDYSDFKFDYYPNPWQMKMVHVFGTQWSHWGTTFMVNRDTFSTDTKYIKVIEHLSNLNFVKSRTASATNVLYDVYYIDHGNTPNLPAVNVVPYDTDYFVTFKNILAKLPEKKEHYIWIASTVCDYSHFDFTYICDPFARDQLHVFPSDRQKFGDTFLVNVNKLREVINDMESLKDYDKINYNQHQRAKRIESPVIVTDFDSHVASVMTDFDFPYATFVTSDNKDIKVVDEEPMSLWDIESKNILITSTGGTRIIVPKEAKQYVETQLYDYPYIKTASRLAQSLPHDIVYLSNGEACAEENYEHLLKVTKGLPNRITRVDGVNGRVQAYHAAAEASNTPWLFTVFAKLKVNSKFDFNWQPDRLQIPKHYMFLAKNPVNGLIYGHQGMIAYNKQMTLDNPGYGLDFTLDSPHETVDLLSGIATYNTDEWSTWRTAFREVIKLKKEDSEISNKRLEAWMTKAEGDYSQYSIDGALDGIAYYTEVDGKTDKLRLSYEWEWLRTRFDDRYKK